MSVIGAAPGVANPKFLARPSPKRCEDCAHTRCQNGRRQPAVVRQAIAPRERQREHPLAERHLRQHAIDQMRISAGHAVTGAG